MPIAKTINEVILKIPSVAFLLFYAKLVTAQTQPPNIILLFADDAGYHDFGFQGSTTFHTPHLDKLAKEGVQFEQAYTTAAVCGPSRAGLLTGIYQQRFGFEENNVPGYMSSSSKLLGDEMGLPLDLNIIPNYLKSYGYRSIILGKWHLGNADKYHPLQRGFDEFYGFRGGARSFWELSAQDISDKPEKKWESGFGDFDEPKTYLTDAIANRATKFIAENTENPFFMFVSFNAVHAPLQATREDLAKIDALSPGLTRKRRILAAMTLAMDRACGLILAELKNQGLEKNTLVVFTNDNGGPDGTSSCNYPLSGCKSNNLEGGIRVPFIMKLPDVIEPHSTYNYPISTLDLLPTFLNLAGGKAYEQEQLDGVDLLPYLTDQKQDQPHQSLYWKKENRGIIRDGNWKMLRFPDRPAELYDLATDETESTNLAYQYPEKVRALFKKLWAWESTLERPLFMLRREYEVNAMQRMDDKRDPSCENEIDQKN
ncbi:MAG: sulfatase-like hydrolase/transferase [Bacteroidota bacterium]